MDTRPVRVLSLFSGVSGLGIGVGIALPESRHVCFVEREFAACEVLAARMADGSLDEAPIFTDIAQFDGRPWRGRVDVIEGGSPCQDLSVAGKRAGIGGRRSGLWHEYARIIEEVQPEAIIFENVSGILSSRTLLHRSEIMGYFDEVRAAATCAKDRWYAERHIERLHRRLLPIHGISALLYVQCCLGELGYESEAGFFTASEVGASHKRERVFVVGYRPRSQVLRQLADGPSGRFGELRESPRGDGLLPQPRRGPEGRDGAGPAVTVLDDTASSRRSGREDTGADPEDAGADWGGSPEPDGGCSDVADTERARREATGGGRQEHSGSEPEPGCRELGDTNEPGLEGWQQRRGLRSSDERAAGEAGDSELANDNDRGCGLRPDEAEPEQAGRRGAREPAGSGSLAIFAPGPGATEQWGRIIAERPWLAPAISKEEIEQLICDLDDGLASTLAGSRTDQLRAAGNGVVSLQAAFALITLARRAGIAE